METIESMLSEAGLDFFSQCEGSTLRKVNKLLRARDDSHLYPINGRYNATDRAIKYYSRVIVPGCGVVSVLEYALSIEGIISNYVNYGKPSR